MNHAILTETETGLKLLSEVWARLLWIKRGGIRNNDRLRMEADFLDARRIMGYILADNILNALSEGNNIEILEHYRQYLDSITLDEFKEIKAYFNWENKGEVIDDNIERIEADYLEACSVLPCTQLIKQDNNIRTPNNLEDYLKWIQLKLRKHHKG